MVLILSFFIATTSVAKIGSKSVYEKGQCQTDIFSVTAPGNNAPPVICGTNTGEHSKHEISSTLTIYYKYLCACSISISSVCGFI